MVLIDFKLDVTIFCANLIGFTIFVALIAKTLIIKYIKIDHREPHRIVINLGEISEVVSSDKKALSMKKIGSIILMVLGGLFLILGIIGIFLPLLPTTPFILLTAYCWARSSTRFHQWLFANKYFGPMLQNWEAHRVIPLKIKWLSTVMMNGSVLLTLFILPHDYGWLKIVLPLVTISVSIWIWQFPHRVK